MAAWPAMLNRSMPFSSRCDHATISILPARAVIFRVPTVSHSETKNSIYNTQRKYTRCGAVCSGTSRAPAYDWGHWYTRFLGKPLPIWYTVPERWKWCTRVSDGLTVGTLHLPLVQEGYQWSHRLWKALICSLNDSRAMLRTGKWTQTERS